MMLLLLGWMPQHPQREYNMLTTPVLREVNEQYQFRDITGSTMRCYSNQSTWRPKPWRNMAFENDTESVLRQVIEDINIDTYGDYYKLYMNATNVVLTLLPPLPQFHAPQLLIYVNGKIVSQNEAQTYALNGQLQISGFEHQKQQSFTPLEEDWIDSDFYERERQRLNISKRIQALPRASYWRFGVDYLATNKMSLKKRLAESEVKRIVLGEFEYEDSKVGTIYGACLPPYYGNDRHKCEVIELLDSSAGVQILLGCTRLCQIKELAKSAYQDVLNSAVVVCQ